MAIKQYKLQGFFSDIGKPIANQMALYDNRFLTATLTKATDDRDVKGVIDGNDIVQLIDTYRTSETYTFKTETESIDSGLLALMFGECWETQATYDAQTTIRFTVPTATPYEVTLSDAGTGLAATDVQVSIVENGTWGRIRPLTVITTGTVAADTVTWTPATKKLTFAAGNAGAPIKVAYKKTYTDVESLGVVASPKKLDNLAFIGTLATTRKEDIIVVIKSMGPSGGWELPVGDKTSISLEFKAKTTGSNRSAVQFLRSLSL